MDIIERTFKRIDVANTGFITDDQLLLALRAKGASGETIRSTFALLKPYFDAHWPTTAATRPRATTCRRLRLRRLGCSCASFSRNMKGSEP